MDVPQTDEHLPDAHGLLSDFGFSALNHISMPSWDGGNHGVVLQQHQIASAQGDAPPLKQTSAGLMEPPAPRRKPKARTLRDRDWEPVKSRVLDLLKTETLREVRAIMMRETGFDATVRQYKSILKKWNAGKNVRRDEMKAIVHKRQRRMVTEPAKPGYVFELRGEPVPEEKIQRFMKREEISIDTAYSPASGAPTPAGGILEYWTPKPDSIAEGPIFPLPLSPVMAQDQVTGNRHSLGPFSTSSFGVTVLAEDNPPHDILPDRGSPSPALSTSTTYLAADFPFQGQTPRQPSSSDAPTLKEAQLFQRLGTLEAKSLKDTPLRELGPMHWLSAFISAELSASLINMGKYTEAGQFLESILSGPQGTYSSGPAWLVRECRSVCGFLLRKTSRCEEAVDILEAVFHQQIAANGPTLSFQEELVRAYKGCGRLREALEIINMGMRARERVLGANHPKTKRAASLRDEILGMMQSGV